MSCGTCSEKMKVGAAAATGAPTATGGVLLDIPTARRVAEAFPKPEAKSSGKLNT